MSAVVFTVCNLASIAISNGNSFVYSFLLFCDSNHTRISIDEVIVPYDECIDSIHGFTWLIIFLSSLFWLFRVVRFFYHAVQYYDIKKFFNAALKIDDVSSAAQFIFLLKFNLYFFSAQPNALN